MSLFSSSRCVLIMGDEGLQVYNVGRLSAKFVDFIPWETEDFEQSVQTLIVKKCKRNPIVILNDMVEQHYRKETIPKVSIIDRGNVLKRRLGVAFPNYRVRAALPLSDKSKKKEGVPNGGSYLFAAVPSSDPFTKTMAAASQSMAPIIGFFLLPVEAAGMVKTLSTKLSKAKRGKSVWTIFIGQHHNGGLRQVVTRNGELALTRMTPIVDTDIEPDLWAKEVSGELSATMSYLSRFGYQESDGLDIIIVANNATKEPLEHLVDIECNLHVLTSQQVASHLGARLGKQEDLRYADPLHASYLGKKNKFQLPMQSAAIERLTKPRRVASYILFGLLIGCAYMSFDLFRNVQKNVTLKDQLVVARQQQNSLEGEYNRELEKKKELGFDFTLVSNSIDVLENLQKQKILPLPVIRTIGIALGADIHLDRIMFNSEELEEVGGSDLYVPDDQKLKKTRLNAVLSISFPNTVTPDEGVAKTNSLTNRLKTNLVGYDVSIIKQVADLSYTGNFVGEAGTNASDEDTPESYDAEIRIRERR